MMEKKPSMKDPAQAKNEHQTVHFFDEPSRPYPIEKLKEVLDQALPHMTPEMMRAYILRSLGARPAKDAENVIMTGCAPPTLSPTISLGPYLKLLNVLGIKYKFLHKEYCCGHNLWGKLTPEEWKEYLAKIIGFNQKNIDLAKELGAKNFYIYCHGCNPLAQLAKAPGITVAHGLDILTEPLKKVKLKVAKPARVGYFQGCWKSSKLINPDLKLNYDTWRSWLDRIEGIEVIDILPHSLCCRFKKSLEVIKKKITDNNIDYLVTPCNACRLFLSRADVNVFYMTVLLLEAVTHKRDETIYSYRPYEEPKSSSEPSESLLL